MSEADALLEELASLEPPLRQPGDIDAKQYAEKLGGGITKEGAEYKLNKKRKEGLLVSLIVRDPERHAPIRVWRKVG